MAIKCGLMIAMRKFRNTMTAFAVAGLVATTPVIAHADIVDDYLAAIPAGQISCQQANNYWTNPADYQDKRSQALLGANFHPRGGEIRAAISRIDEAAHRCGLLGGGGGQATGGQTTGGQGGQGGQNNQAPAQQGSTPQSSTPQGSSASDTVLIAGQSFPVPDFLAPVVDWLRSVLGNLGIRI